MGLIERTKIKILAGLYSSLESSACSVPWFMTLFHLQSQQWLVELFSLLITRTHSLLVPSSSYKDAYDYIEHT